MNTNRHFDEEDLALYAMRLLDEPDASEVARFVATADGKRRFADVRQTLAAFAEAMVEPQAAPPGSLDRLMRCIAQEKKPVATPAPVARSSVPLPARRNFPARAAPWIGWAVAAGLALTAGKLYQDQTVLHSTLRTQTAQAEQKSAEASRERDRLQATLAEQTNRLDALRAHSTAEKNETTNLQSAMTGQTAKANQETAKADAQATLAANTERERDQLRSTVAAGASQIAQMKTEAAAAEQVLQALTDPAALRVTLTRPKSSAAPTGRATYVASRGTLVFLANNLAPLKSNKVYQLWLMPADGSKPVPIGTFAPDARGAATVVTAHFPRSVSAKGFSVTIEKEGGSQTPTLPIVLASV